jgi:hypothetical protein
MAKGRDSKGFISTARVEILLAHFQKRRMLIHRLRYLIRFLNPGDPQTNLDSLLMRRPLVGTGFRHGDFSDLAAFVVLDRIPRQHGGSCTGHHGKPLRLESI